MSEFSNGVAERSGASPTFQKGDRVKVEAEGVVAYSSAYGTDVKTDAGGMLSVNDPSALTLIERPVEPLAPGSVVRAVSGGIWVVEPYGRGVSYYYAGRSSDSFHTPKTLAETVRDNDNITLIYDGSNKA